MFVLNITLLLRWRLYGRFLKTIGSIFSNNATNLRHRTSHTTPCCLTTQRSYCDHRLLRRHFTVCVDVVLLQDVIRVHRGLESRVVVRQVRTGDSETMRVVLRELRRLQIGRFFVHLSSGDTALFLKAVISALQSGSLYFCLVISINKKAVRYCASNHRAMRG